MWTKTIKTKFKGEEVVVQVWLSDTNENAQEVVKVQSMLNEYYLEEIILMQSRDAAYDFIQNYPASLAQAFVRREAYSLGAV